jgi:hypothetical protein
MRIPARAWLGVASVGSLLGATCAGTPEAAIGVSSITPAVAYNNHKIELVIHGGPFRPAYDIDTGDGRAATQQGAFTAYLAPKALGGQRVAVNRLTWLSTTALAASLREDVPQGVYDVVVLDPRGVAGELEEGFSSLGRDTTPPNIPTLEPDEGTVVNPSAEVPVVFEAEDAPGTLSTMRWTVSADGVDSITGTCPLGPNTTDYTCRFVFAVPPRLRSGDILKLDVEAVDAAGNSYRDGRTLAVGIAPVVRFVSPLEGPADGNAEIAVEGDNFIPGTQVLVGGVPIEPNGGTIRDEHHIVGKTPAHDPGVFPIFVRTGGVSVKAPEPYTFVAQPLVLAVTPTSGSPAGGTFVTIVGKGFRDDTEIRFGSGFATTAFPLLCPVHVGPNRIEGYAPPGDGLVSIFALDPVSGTSERPLAFTYLTEDSPDASPPMTPPCLADGGLP